MKGKDDSSPDVCPWERTQNIREMHGWRYALGVSGSSHILDTQVLGSDKGRQIPLDDCRAIWTNRRSVEAWTPPSRSMCSGACSQATVKRTD